MQQSTLAVQAVISFDARAHVSSIADDAVTVHPAGLSAQPSLHWATLDELEAWYADLGKKIRAERIRRTDTRRALDEARAHLRRVGA